MATRVFGLTRTHWLILSLCLTAFLGQRFVTEQTPTADEHLHTTRGLSFWWTTSSQLSHDVPPLANAIQAAPAAIRDTTRNLKAFAGWKTADGERVAAAYFSQRPAAQSEVIRGRYVALLLGLLFVAYVMVWLEEHFDLATMAIGGVLLATHPSVLAYMQLSNTDFFVAALVTVLMCEVVRGFQSDGWGPPIRVGLVVAAAVASDHRAIVPVAIVLGLATLWAAWGTDRYRGRALDIALRHAKDLAVVAVITLFVVNLAHRFDHTFLTVTDILATVPPDHAPPPDNMRHTLGKAPGWLPVPLPYTHVVGLFEAWDSGPQQGTYFLGGMRTTGGALLFPLLLVIKSPVALLLLWLFGLGWLIARRPKLSKPLTFVATASVSLGIGIALSGLGVEMRNALVVLLPLLLLAARAGGIAFSAFSPRRATWLTAATMFSLGFGALVVPDYLGDFNLIVGRERGHNISIAGEDRGQDTARFAQRAKEKKWKPLLYEPFSTGGKHVPRRYQVDYRGLTCDTMPDKRTYIALHRVRRVSQPGCYRWLKRAKLVEVIHDHIEVYRFTPKPKRRSVKRKAKSTPAPTSTPVKRVGAEPLRPKTKPTPTLVPAAKLPGLGSTKLRAPAARTPRAPTPRAPTPRAPTSRAPAPTKPQPVEVAR